jgi:hypothetical protein
MSEESKSAVQYVFELNKHLSHLYAFARRMNELDFAVSMSGEFRGMQDEGWATTITAYEVYEELLAFTAKEGARSKAEFRTILMLYCQLSEAGGFYESLKNVMGVVTLKPYLLWPFKDLVQARNNPRRIIGPNANKTFRDLAENARQIGFSGLSRLLEVAFRDDLRNAISHADYVIWGDGVRLRNRNGGYASLLSFDEVNSAFTRGMGFFQVLSESNREVVQSFDPPKTIVGRFSANFPMPWTVTYDSETGAFGISGSSPGPVTTPEYLKQNAINGLLGGKALSLFAVSQDSDFRDVESHIVAAGFEPNCVELPTAEMEKLLVQILEQSLWDERFPLSDNGKGLLLSPWGFQWITCFQDFDRILDDPLVEFDNTQSD